MPALWGAALRFLACLLQCLRASRSGTVRLNRWPDRSFDQDKLSADARSIDGIEWA